MTTWLKGVATTLMGSLIEAAKILAHIFFGIPAGVTLMFLALLLQEAVLWLIPQLFLRLLFIDLSGAGPIVFICRSCCTAISLALAASFTKNWTGVRIGVWVMGIFMLFAFLIAAALSFLMVLGLI